jgi:hypothetical protein
MSIFWQISKTFYIRPFLESYWSIFEVKNRTVLFPVSIYCPFKQLASAKLPNPTPNARWRDGFSLVPSIPVGFADKRKVGALVQNGITSCWSRILYLTLISLLVWLFKVKLKKRLMQAG